MKKKTTRRKKTRTRRKKDELEEEEDLPIYKKLYPPLKEIFIYDEDNEIQNNLKVKSNISKRKKRKSNIYDEQDLDEYFLDKLLEDPCPIPRQKVINTLSNFIQKSKLIGKLEKDYETAEKKAANNTLSITCAEKLKFEEYERGDIIFKIGDSGENFYFILSGNVSVLKLKEIPDIQMTYMEYIRYCIYLLNQGEEYLLNEVLKANEAILSVSSIEDIKTINKIIFMKILNQDISKKITNNKQLKSYFQMNMQRYSDYDMRQDELDYLDQEKSKGKLGAAKEWEEYITKRCSLLVSEEVFFQSYENIITDLAPKKIICYNYEPFLYLGAGLFFGDTALDFENNKRNATIRAEEKTYLAYLQREDYINIISPMNKITRLKEIEFLYTKFFFMSINSHIFEKNFFHLFSHKEYYHGSILFSQGTIPRSVIFVRSGRISLDLKCSIIDIQNLIKFLFDNIFLNPIFQRLSLGQKNRYMPIERILNIKSYINDPVLMRLKTHNNDFINEMKVVRNYTITILTNNEIIGLEEIFLRMPYITKASVINSKVDCYELSLVNLDKLLNCGKEVILYYTKYSMNKISTLIERLQNIKQNYINMSLAKYEGKSEQNKLGKNLKINVNYEKSIKEEIKNNTKVNFNNNNEIKDNSEKQTLEENKMELTTVIDQKTSSPIKTFMTCLSPQNKIRIEEMKNVITKLRKRNLRFTKEPFNYNYKKVLPKPIALNKVKSIKNNTKEKLKNIDTNNKTSSVIYNHDDKLITKYLIEKLFIGKKDENNQTLKHNQNESEPNILHKFNIKTRNKNINEPIAKDCTFNWSYIPLNLMCQKDEKKVNKINKNNINELLTTNMKINKFLNMQSPIYSSDNILINDNNESESKSNTINNNAINNNRINLNKRLKALNRNVNLVKNNNNKAKEIIQIDNIVPKKILISGVIKDFYKDIKLNGYSSLIKNKKLNTIYLRKYNKKYNSAEKAYQNIKVQLLKDNNKINNSLPQIVS